MHAVATESTPESMRFKQRDSANRNSIQNVYVQNQGTSPYSRGLGSIQTSSGVRPNRQSIEQNTEFFIGHKKVQPKNLGGLRQSAAPIMVPKNVQNFQFYPVIDESFEGHQGFGVKKHQRQKSAKIGGGKKRLMIEASNVF